MYSVQALLREILLLCILEKLECQRKVIEVETVGISNDKWEEMWSLINRGTQNETGFGGTKGKWCQSNMVY